MSSGSDILSDFLILNRNNYLKALNENKARDWTVVVGNEAGDLDSSASSIAYSYLASALFHRPTIALLQSPRTDLHLRAENLHAYEIAHMHPTQSDLLCIDDIPAENLSRVCTSSFVLVDHNRLVPRFSAPPLPRPPNVVGIIDHHDDEGAHKDADPRLITTPVGSCSSLVAQYFAPAWGTAKKLPPRELATLLLAAIFIDTNGLKPGGKAVSIDHDAVTFLFPNSTFTSPSLFEVTSESYKDHEGVALVTRTLNDRKQSVSHLSTRDLLRRDYKEYEYESSFRTTRIGLATVPQNPKHWFPEETSASTWRDVDVWIGERKLDVLGVLFTYRRKGKHERQELWVVKNGLEGVQKKLWEGLEKSEELRLEQQRKWMNGSFSRDSGGEGRALTGDFITPAGAKTRLWLQGNEKATRKVVAPLVKDLMESL